MNKKVSTVIVSVILVGGFTAATWYVLSSKTGGTKAGSSQSQENADTGSDTTSNPSGNPATPASGTGNSPSAPASVTAISITSSAFSPSAVTVKKGTPVTWVNKDSATHALDEVNEDNSRAGIRSPQLKANESYTFTFAKTGRYEYRCVLHPELTGTVTVTD